MSDPIGRRTAATVPVPGENSGASETICGNVGGRAVASATANRPAPAAGEAGAGSTTVELGEQRFSVAGGGNDTGASGGRTLPTW